MTVLFRTDLEKYEQGPNQSAESYGDELVARANMVEFPSSLHRDQELTRLFKHGVRKELRERLEEIEVQHPAGANFDFHTYKRMLSATRGSEARPTQPTGVPSWKTAFQKLAVPVMAIGASLSAIDPQEDGWAAAVYWNEQVDELDSHPDSSSFLRAYTMAVQARVRTRVPQCYRCGERGHMRDKCTFSEDVCFRCKKPGHRSEDCKVPR